MSGDRDGSFDAELAELALELWVAAGVLLRALRPPEIAELEADLAEWDRYGPDPGMQDDWS